VSVIEIIGIIVAVLLAGVIAAAILWEAFEPYPPPLDGDDGSSW
jgi:hypothetical protein